MLITFILKICNTLQIGVLSLHRAHANLCIFPDLWAAKASTTLSTFNVLGPSFREALEDQCELMGESGPSHAVVRLAWLGTASRAVDFYWTFGQIRKTQ